MTLYVTCIKCRKERITIKDVKPGSEYSEIIKNHGWIKTDKGYVCPRCKDE